MNFELFAFKAEAKNDSPVGVWKLENKRAVFLAQSSGAGAMRSAERRISRDEKRKPDGSAPRRSPLPRGTRVSTTPCDEERGSAWLWYMIVLSYLAITSLWFLTHSISKILSLCAASVRDSHQAPTHGPLGTEDLKQEPVPTLVPRAPANSL